MGYLPLVESAATYHDEALRAALNADFDEAHSLFLIALHEVRIVPVQDAATITQAARISRDDSFTFTREAVKAASDGNPQAGIFDRAILGLENSAE